MIKFSDLLDANGKYHTMVQLCRGKYKNQWVPARPIRDTSIILRIKDAWLVLTDKCDALLWHEDEK